MFRCNVDSPDPSFMSRFKSLLPNEPCHSHQSATLERPCYKRVLGTRIHPPLNLGERYGRMLLGGRAEGLRFSAQRFQSQPRPLLRILCGEKSNLHIQFAPRHAAQYPPISSRETSTRNRQSFSTCCFNFSKLSLTNSVIFPQRRHAMWM